MPSNSPQDLEARAHTALDRATDLRLADPAAVAHGHLLATQANPRRAQLHLHGPAIPAVIHPELPQSSHTDGAERPKISEPLPRSQCNQYNGESVAESSVLRHRTDLALTELTAAN